MKVVKAINLYKCPDLKAEANYFPCHCWHDQGLFSDMTGPEKEEDQRENRLE